MAAGVKSSCASEGPWFNSAVT